MLKFAVTVALIYVSVSEDRMPGQEVTPKTPDDFDNDKMPGFTPEPIRDCTDTRQDCAYKKLKGGCKNKATQDWMYKYCQASCTPCSGPKINFETCKDNKEKCGRINPAECLKIPEKMLVKCPQSCAFCTQAGVQPYPKELLQRVSAP